MSQETSASATIERALATVSTPSLRPASVVKAEVDALEKRSVSLLGVEQVQADVIQDRIAELKQDLLASLFIESERQPPPLLSPEILTWRHPKRIKGVPVPRLAPISIDSPCCRFSASRLTFVRTLGYADNVPGPLSDYYADIQEGLARRVARLRTRAVELSWRFEGVIPDEIRERIVEHVDDFGEGEIILVADAPLETWRFRERRAELEARPARLLDPLVVGLKAGRLWLLDAFDPTPIERYAADEFSERTD